RDDLVTGVQTCALPIYVKREEQKLPFTDEELKRMYDACHKYGKTSKYKWTGEDLADFISLSIYTGLRISDVALFQIDRMLPTGEIGRASCRERVERVVH